MQSQNLYAGEIDESLITAFFDEVNDAHRECERILLSLEQDAEDPSLVADLFRFVHTIKGNLTCIGLKRLTPLLQSVEDILEELRQNRFSFDDLLSDLVLLAMDTTKDLVNSNLNGSVPIMDNQQFDEICQSISAIIKVSEERRSIAIYDAIIKLDPNTKIRPPNANSVDPSAITGADVGSELESDLGFLKQLLPAIEQRSHYWAGRHERILDLALMMNSYADNPVDPNQLAVAVYAHDIGMAFLPLDILHKNAKLSTEESRLMKRHVMVSYILLQQMPQWLDAAEMVLHHHEHCDGNGYPKGLTEQDICDGAKILAIAGTFEACSNSRPHYQTLRRPLIRAVLEVNRQSGSQFSPRWVNIFNQVVKDDRFKTRGR